MSIELCFDYSTAAAGILNFKQSDIDELQRWTVNSDKIKFVPKDLTNKQLLIFYNACYCDVQKAKKCIENYYLARKNAPEHFDNRILSSEDLKPSTESLEFAVLPHQSPEKYDIIYHRLHHTEPSKWHLDPGSKLLLMTIDACLYSRGPQAGVIFLMDMRGVKLTHLTRISISSIRKLFFYAQEALPVRLKAIHIMNTVSFFDKVLMIIKPFMNKELYEMLNLHSTKEDMEKFYKEVLPRHCLPPDYGGDLPDTQTLNRDNLRLLEDMQQYFKADEAQRKAAIPEPVEKKTSPKNLNIFRKLDID